MLWLIVGQVLLKQARIESSLTLVRQITSPLLSLLLFPFPHPPLLRSSPRYNTAGGSGSAVSSPSGVWGAAPAEIEFGAF